MKSPSVIALLVTAALGSVAIAQTPPPGAPSAGMPLTGRVNLPPPNPHPAGGTDNTSNGDYVIGPDFVMAEELRPHAGWARGEVLESLRR